MSKFSVVIPLFNKEEDIKKTVMSVLAQSFNDFEVIIIDDGSTDNSVFLIKSINDNRIQVFSKMNEGVSIARNFGVEKATSEYIAFLDADDYWHPNHLENLDSLIHLYPNQLWFSTAYEKKYSTGFTSAMISPKMNSTNWKGVVTNFFKNSLIDCLTWTSAVCMKKTFFTSLNGFETTLTHGEDIDLWIRAALKSPLVFSNQISATYNLKGSNRSDKVSSNNRSNLNLNRFEEEAKTNIYLKKYLDLNRYSLAIKFKVSNDLTSFKEIIKFINLNNLNRKQRFLLKQHRFVLKFFLKFKNILIYFNINLSSF